MRRDGPCQEGGGRGGGQMTKQEEAEHSPSRAKERRVMWRAEIGTQRLCDGHN